MLRIILRLAFSGVVLLTLPCSSPAAIGYNYQLYTGKGDSGAVGDATLGLSNNTTTVYANFRKGIGSFSDNLVMFIDDTPGGFTTTSAFNDSANPQQTSISGFKTSRSVATFAPDFTADYALVIGIGDGSAIYKLVDDATGPHLQLIRSGLNFVYADSANHPTYSFQFDWADIGLPSQNTNFFKFETSYISDNGYRNLESFEGLTGTRGFDFITFTNYDTYGVQPIPENTNAALATLGGFAVALSLGAHLRRRLPARNQNCKPRGLIYHHDSGLLPGARHV